MAEPTLHIYTIFSHGLLSSDSLTSLIDIRNMPIVISHISEGCYFYDAGPDFPSSIFFDNFGYPLNFTIGTNQEELGGFIAKICKSKGITIPEDRINITDSMPNVELKVTRNPEKPFDFAASIHYATHNDLTGLGMLTHDTNKSLVANLSMKREPYYLNNALYEIHVDMTSKGILREPCLIQLKTCMGYTDEVLQSMPQSRDVTLRGNTMASLYQPLQEVTDETTNESMGAASRPSAAWNALSRSVVESSTVYPQMSSVVEQACPGLPSCGRGVMGVPFDDDDDIPLVRQDSFSANPGGGFGNAEDIGGGGGFSFGPAPAGGGEFGPPAGGGFGPAGGGGGFGPMRGGKTKKKKKKSNKKKKKSKKQSKRKSK